MPAVNMLHSKWMYNFDTNGAPYILIHITYRLQGGYLSILHLQGREKFTIFLLTL